MSILLLYFVNIKNEYIQPHIYKIIITISIIIGGYIIFKNNNTKSTNIHLNNNHEDIINKVNNLFYKQEWNYKNINKKYIISDTFHIQIKKLKDIYYNDILQNNYNDVELNNTFNEDVIYIIHQEYEILENKFIQEQTNIINQIPNGKDILKKNLQDQIQENKIIFTEILNIFQEIKKLLLIYIK